MKRKIVAALLVENPLILDVFGDGDVTVTFSIEKPVENEKEMEL